MMLASDSSLENNADSPAELSTNNSADGLAEPDAGQAEMDAAGSEVLADRPAWQQLALTDARSGQPFTLADFAGRTVFVEPRPLFWATAPF